MAGLFPVNGVTAPNTLGAATGITSKTGCDKLFHPARCVPRFDPVAANAVISELVNAINLTDPYDCSRLDNLKTTLAKVQNLCNLPTKTLNGANGYLDDFLAGCFSGVPGKITIADLLDDIIAAIPGICDLPTATNPDLDDLIGMCVDGVERKVPVSAIKTLIVPTPTTQSGGYYRDDDAGEVALNGVYTTVPKSYFKFPNMANFHVTIFGSSVQRNGALYIGDTDHLLFADQNQNQQTAVYDYGLYTETPDGNFWKTDGYKMERAPFNLPAGSTVTIIREYSTARLDLYNRVPMSY